MRSHIRTVAGLAVLALGAVAIATSGTDQPTKIDAAGTNITFPVTAAFYYPWFPETWSVNGVHVKYHPTDAYYSSDDAAVIGHHMAAMDYAHINVAIASWWGQNTHSEQTRISLMLDKAQATGVKVAFYYEKEGNANPSQAEITADLNYLQSTYGTHPGAATVNGKIVVFVYNANDTTCAIADKWKAANAGIGAYIDLKVFSGYATCANQPDSWHQYSPASAAGTQGSYMYAISPGFWRADETTARLARDITRWQSNVSSMNTSVAKWHLITTFNEWGEGSAVEGATEWSHSTTGYGEYIDALHNLLTPSTPPTPTTTIAVTSTTGAITTTVGATTTTVAGGSTVTVGSLDDATVSSSAGLADTNYGKSSTLSVDFDGNISDFLANFAIPSTCAAPTAAMLSLTVAGTSYANSVTGGEFYAAPGTWNESNVTATNAPIRVGSPVHTGTVAVNAAYQINVGSLLSAGVSNGVFSIRATTSSTDGAAYVSRNATNGATAGPKLQLTCGGSTTTMTSTTVAATTTTPPATTTTVAGGVTQSVVVGAGDICQTGTLANPTKVGAAIQLEVNKGAIPITMGDNQYDAGAYSDFVACYDKAWGSFKAQTHPALGNHDLGTPGGAGYFQYFGSAGGPAPGGWYSWNINADWMAIVLNSEITGTPMTNQLAWLKSVLTANPTKNVLAYMHEPVASSGQHGASTRSRQLYDVLYPLGVDIILTGHDHDYEQFALLGADPNTTSATGVKVFVVGTGGASHYSFGAAKPGSIARGANVWGYEKLTLRKNDYDFAFVATSPSTFTDAGHGVIVR